MNDWTSGMSGSEDLDLEQFGIEKDLDGEARPSMWEEIRALLDRECPDEPVPVAPIAAPPHRAPWPLYDVRALMERPFFSLSSRPRQTPIDHVSPCGRWRLHAAPTDGQGVASIRDSQLLILIASQLIHEQPRGNAVPEVVDLNPRQLMQARGLTGSGREYALLRAAFARLRGTRYTTNIQPDGSFGLEQTFTLIEDVTVGDRRGHLDVRLSGWFRTAVEERRVLQLSGAYLTIPGNYERWLYRVVRKHVGQQPHFQMSVSTLWGKSGQGSPLPRFKYELRKVVEANALPDYGVYWLDRGKQEPMVTMGPRPGAFEMKRRTARSDTAREEWQ
ncbi:replication initiator protein A [Methylorubrum extorquens]